MLSPDLLQSLQERNADRQHATDGGLHSKRRAPCVTLKQLQTAERKLGFFLPEIIRSLYLQIGNGGLGPAYGILKLTGRSSVNGESVTSVYQDLRELVQTNEAWKWPSQLLPLASYGCGMWSCVDLTYQRLPMFLWDPNNLWDDLEGEDAKLNRVATFWNEGVTLKKWLENWITGVENPEPTWPSKRWVKKRLTI